MRKHFDLESECLCAFMCTIENHIKTPLKPSTLLSSPLVSSSLQPSFYCLLASPSPVFITVSCEEALHSSSAPCPPPPVYTSALTSLSLTQRTSTSSSNPHLYSLSLSLFPWCLDKMFHASECNYKLVHPKIREEMELVGQDNKTWVILTEVVHLL